MNDIFEWNRVLLNEMPLEFLFEVIFRTSIMFTVLLLTLKFTGKRGVRQLSIFETVLIIALGSAAGDPMFYEDVGLIPAIVVFLVVILFYRLVTWLTGKSKRFEEFIEGKTECLIYEGKFSITSFEKETLAQDEFFSELRMRSIDHLGQIKDAYLEPNGQVSVFFYSDDEVKPGLPLHPKLFLNKSKNIPKAGTYACAFCGHTEKQKAGTAICGVCQKSEWVEAIKTLRKA